MKCGFPLEGVLAGKQHSHRQKETQKSEAAWALTFPHKVLLHQQPTREVKGTWSKLFSQKHNGKCHSRASDFSSIFLGV